MDIPRVVRALRRHAGLSQRELAAQLGVSPSAVAAWETGKRRPSLSALETALDRFELDLTLCPRAEPAPEPVLRHLRMSLTMRLRLALGEPPSPYQRASGAAWCELRALGRRGRVLLQPPLAIGLWLPRPPCGRVEVTMHEALTPLPATTTVAVTESTAALPASAVPITLEDPVRVWALPPAELLASERAQLLQVAAALDVGAPVDDAGRRRPEHRDPNEWREAARMLMTKGTDQLPRPRGEFSRAWRLGGTVSLAQVVRRPYGR